MPLHTESDVTRLHHIGSECGWKSDGFEFVNINFHKCYVEVLGYEKQQYPTGCAKAEDLPVAVKITGERGSKSEWSRKCKI